MIDRTRFADSSLLVHWPSDLYMQGGILRERNQTVKSGVPVVAEFTCAARSIYTGIAVSCSSASRIAKLRVSFMFDHSCAVSVCRGVARACTSACCAAQSRGRSGHRERRSHASQAADGRYCTVAAERAGGTQRGISSLKRPKKDSPDDFQPSGSHVLVVRCLAFV